MPGSDRPAGRGPGRQRPSFIEEARRAQIVDAAAQVVGDVGYANASMARIARCAGVSKGLISYHFRDKDELMEQTMLAVHTRIRTEIVSEVDVRAPADEVLRAVVLHSARYGTAHRREIRVLNQIAENLRTAEGRLRFTLADNEPFYRTSEQLYRRGQREGRFRDFDTRVMAVTYQAAMDSLFAYADAYPDTDLQAYAEGLADLLLAAVAATPGRTRGSFS